MNTNVSSWVIEFMIRKCPDDSLLDRLFAMLPLNDCGSRVKKALLIRRIRVEVTKGEIVPKILEFLELVGELDFADGKGALEKLREAYRDVAVDCAAKHLVLEDYAKYFEIVQKIWRERIQKMGDQGSSGLVDEKTLSWVDDIEAATFNVEIRDKILSMNTRYEAIKAVKSYCAEAYKEIGPTFLEKTAIYAISMREAGTRKDAIMKDVNGEENGFEGLEDIRVASKSPCRPSEKPFVDEAVNEAHKEVVPAGPSETAKHEINMQKDGTGDDDIMEDVIGEEQRIEGLEDIRVAHNSPSRPIEKLFVDEIRGNQESVENIREAHKEVAPTGPSETAKHVVNMQKAGTRGDKIMEDVIGEEQRREGLEDISEAHKSPIRPREKPFVDEIGEEQGFVENVIEAHNELAPSGRPSEDKIGEEQGLKGLENVYEARNEGTSTRPCEKLSEDMIVREQGFQRSRNVNEARNEVAPSGPCNNFSKVKIVDKQGLKGLGNVNEARNVATPSRPGEKPFVGKIKEEQGSEHSENVKNACNDATPSGPCQKPSDGTPHTKHRKRQRIINVRKKNSKAKLADTDDLDEDTRIKKYPFLPTPEFDKVKAELQSSFADLHESVRDPLPEAIKIAEQVSLNLNKNTNAGEKRGGISFRDPLPEARKTPEQVPLNSNKGKNVAGNNGGKLNIGPTDHINTNAEGKRGGVSFRDPLPEARKTPEQVSLDCNKGKNVAGSSGGGLNVGPKDHVNTNAGGKHGGISFRDPLPEARKTPEQVSLSSNKGKNVAGSSGGGGLNVGPTDHVNTNAEGKHGGVIFRDPLPEARKIPEQVSLDSNKGKNVAGSSGGGGLNVGPTDHANQGLASDPFQFQVSPKKPAKAKRLWSNIEEDALRKGVKELGRGNWKKILVKYHDVLGERTYVDLKDKWRNLTQ